VLLYCAFSSFKVTLNKVCVLLWMTGCICSYIMLFVNRFDWCFFSHVFYFVVIWRVLNKLHLVCGSQDIILQLHSVWCLICNFTWIIDQFFYDLCYQALYFDTAAYGGVLSVHRMSDCRMPLHRMSNRRISLCRKSFRRIPFCRISVCRRVDKNHDFFNKNQKIGFFWFKSDCFYFNYILYVYTVSVTISH